MHAPVRPASYSLGRPGEVLGLFKGTKLMAAGGAATLCLAVSASSFAGGGPDIEAGASLAAKLCARCHATGTTGPSPHEAAPPFRTFAQKWPLENLEEALAEGIVVGHPAMPVFELSTGEIDDLIGYLGTLQ